jgi:hypothetical protein
VHLLPLHLHEPALALLLHVHPLRRLQPTHARQSTARTGRNVVSHGCFDTTEAAGSGNREAGALPSCKPSPWLQIVADGRPGEGNGGAVFSAWVWVLPLFLSGPPFSLTRFPPPLLRVLLTLGEGGSTL